MCNLIYSRKSVINILLLLLLCLLNNLFFCKHKYVITESFLMILHWLSLSPILKYTHLLVKLSKKITTSSLTVLLYSQAIYLQRTSDVDNDWNETKLNSNSTYESRDWEKYYYFFSRSTDTYERHKNVFYVYLWLCLKPVDSKFTCCWCFSGLLRDFNFCMLVFEDEKLWAYFWWILFN